MDARARAIAASTVCGEPVTERLDRRDRSRSCETAVTRCRGRRRPRSAPRGAACGDAGMRPQLARTNGMATTPLVRASRAAPVCPRRGPIRQRRPWTRHLAGARGRPRWRCCCCSCSPFSGDARARRTDGARAGRAVRIRCGSRRALALAQLARIHARVPEYGCVPSSPGAPMDTSTGSLFAHGAASHRACRRQKRLETQLTDGQDVVLLSRFCHRRGRYIMTKKKSRERRANRWTTQKTFAETRHSCAMCRALVFAFRDAPRDRGRANE